MCLFVLFFCCLSSYSCFIFFNCVFLIVFVFCLSKELWCSGIQLEEGYKV